MKKIGKHISVFIVIAAMLSANIYAYGKSTYDVTINSGDVVNEFQYSEERFSSDYDPDFKSVDTLTINAYGDEPVIIKKYGFSGCWTQQVKKIVINGTGKIILGEGAFQFTGITDIDITSNIVLDARAESVFSASALKSVKIRCGLCPGMFQECTSLYDVEFLNPDIKVIPQECFDTCGLIDITIPNSVTKIEDRAFKSNFWLKSLTFNEGLESIGEESFVKCFDLKDLLFPSTLKTLGKNCFDSCESLDKVIFNDGLESIEKFSFMSCKNLKSVSIPASVTEIGDKAFGYYKNEKSEYEKYDGFTIYGYTGTAAEKYADENGFTFIPLDAESSVEGVSYTPIWNSVNDYSFKVGNRPLKLQVIEANGATRTFTRHASNVDIKAYDNQGNAVHDTSADLAYEVWTVKTRLTPDSDLKVRAKYDNVWENAAYDFRVTTLYSDQTLKSAELAKESGSLAPVDCKIVTGSGVKKVRIEYEDGMTTTVNTSLATFDETNLTYTYNITAKPRHTGENLFKVYIKTSDGWKFATTLTYTAE